MKRGNIIVIDDDQKIREVIESSIQAHQVYSFRDTVGVSDTFRRKNADLAIIDLNLKGKNEENRFSGLSYIKTLRERFPDISIMVLSEYSDIDLVFEAAQNGADMYIWKHKANIDSPEFRTHVNNLIKQKWEKEEKKRIINAEIWGNSPNTRQLRGLISHHATTGESFFLRGEPGVGKEIIVKFLHQESSRKYPNRGIRIIDLRSQDQTMLLEISKVTNQNKLPDFLKQFKYNLLYLKNIDKTPLEFQELMFQIIKERKHPTLSIPLKAQIIFSIEKEPVEYHDTISINLINEVPSIEVKPLRDRKEDLHEFITKWLEVQECDLGIFTEEIKEHFLNYNYPGNISELKSLLSTMLDKHKIEFKQKNAWKNTPISWTSVPSILFNSPLEYIDLGKEVAKTELKYIEEALQMYEGEKGKAAKYLGISGADNLYKTYIAKYQKKYPEIVAQYPKISESYSNK